jgi:hypothetical protein
VVDKGINALHGEFISYVHATRLSHPGNGPFDDRHARQKASTGAGVTALENRC